MAKKIRAGKKQLVEIDIVAKGNGNGNSVRRRNRKPRNKRAVDGFNDTRRWSAGGGGNFPLTSYSSVPAGMGYSMPKTRLGMSQKGEIITISRCEMVTQMSAHPTEAFETPENAPLIPALIPWLAGVAANFSKWRWRRLNFRYIPVVGTGTNGSVGYGYGYDMAEGTPTSLIQVSAFDQFKLHAVWQTDQDGIDADIGRFGRDWYPYIGLGIFKTATPTDQNLYSPGYLSAYSGISALTENTELGFIWVDYVVELCDPISASLQPTNPP